ncbi:MAG: ABC transporter ATP-binding protein [Micromonosporaceae bacterium]|nr:ABC transporter ATP-binding protein [Micromonosporaceae bacterium]
MTSADTVIHARGLTKRFGTLTAVDGIDFDVERGEFFGILGPNGAGKSSTMRMIGCVSSPTGGGLSVLGLDPVRDGHRIRARLGVCPQADSLDAELTVRENVTTYARYFGLSRRIARQRAMELLDFMQLADRAGDSINALSGGMKRRLVIARALVNQPDLVLLDEPTTGLDPQARHLVWERLFRLKDQGVTVVLTTHYMDEAEQLCDRLVVMDRGRIVGEGTPAALVKEHAGQQVVELRYPGPASEAMTAVLAGIGERIEILPDRILLYCADGEKALAEIHRRGPAPTGVLVRRGGLEDVFLRLAGRQLVE